MNSGQARPIDDMEAGHVTEDSGHEIRIRSIEHDPKFAALLQPSAQSDLSGRIIGEAPSGQHEMINPVECFWSWRQKTIADDKNVIGKIAAGIGPEGTHQLKGIVRFGWRGRTSGQLRLIVSEIIQQDAGQWLAGPK